MRLCRLLSKTSGCAETVGIRTSLNVRRSAASSPSGVFKNEAAGEVQTLEGMIDKKSQRVAWCVQGKSWPIVETGLSNLTQDTAPVLVHFDDGQTQQ